MIVSGLRFAEDAAMTDVGDNPGVVKVVPNVLETRCEVVQGTCIREDDVSDGWERHAPCVCGDESVQRVSTIIGRHRRRWARRVEMRL